MRKRVRLAARVAAITAADLFYALGFVTGSRGPWRVAAAIDRMERRLR